MYFTEHIVSHVRGVAFGDALLAPYFRSRFGFSAQPNHAFHPSWVGELIADNSVKDKTLTFKHMLTASRCIGQLLI